MADLVAAAAAVGLLPPEHPDALCVPTFLPIVMQVVLL